MNKDNQQKPRPHAEAIKAWADGATIQTLVGEEWVDCKHPDWFESWQYRVKPCEEPKQELLPLSKGEEALVKAVRENKIFEVMCHRNGGLVAVDFYDDADAVTQALIKIKAEQDAAAEMYHSLAS